MKNKYTFGKNIALNLSRISKKYLIHHDKPTLVERIMNGKNEHFYALRDINLTVKKGERIGVIGANGSGKTTLLKIITGIAAPSIGRVNTFGKIVSLIDLEAGFHPDLTGIQNIYLNGTLLGMSKKEITEKLVEIVKFADIGKFIDAQLFTYSSGMKLRLGFSVAVHANPEILVLDENLAVGDQDFKKKSFDKIQELFNQGKTVIIASHNMEVIVENCQKVIWLENGRIKAKGPVRKILSSYLKSSE